VLLGCVYLALHVAVQNGHLNTVKSLLKHSRINAEAINMRLVVNAVFNYFSDSKLFAMLFLVCVVIKCCARLKVTVRCSTLAVICLYTGMLAIEPVKLLKKCNK